MKNLYLKIVSKIICHCFCNRYREENKCNEALNAKLTAIRTLQTWTTQRGLSPKLQSSKPFLLQKIMLHSASRLKVVSSHSKDVGCGAKTF